MDHDIVMAVRPNIMNTTASLIKDYKPEKRKCVADNELFLYIFNKYTQRNCQLNEISWRTQVTCKCATFALPRVRGTKICRTKAELDCVQRVEDLRMRQILERKTVDFGCLPSCDSISYDAEVSMARLHRFEYQKAARQAKEGKRRRHSRIFISFKDEQFFASRRSEIYGATDFIAECGGILGLFMGISILSVVEILYFSTLRIGCSIYKRRKMKKRRKQQLKELNELVIGDNTDDEPKSPENNNHNDRPNDLPELRY